MAKVSFYQTWKTKTLPDKFLANQKKWLNVLDPDKYNYILLDDADLRKLVSDNFPQYLKAYDAFTSNIERVDFARCVMMYLGGVYADLDTYPVKPIDVWVDANKIVLGREPISHARKLYGGRDIVLCNAFMISLPPKNHVWIDLMDYIVANYEPNYKPVYNTGPMAMTLFYEKHKDLFLALGDGIIITDPCVFFPLEGDGKVSKRCNIDKDTYVVHEWENTWVTKWWNDPQWFNRRYWSWALISLIVIISLYVYNRKHKS